MKSYEDSLSSQMENFEELKSHQKNGLTNVEEIREKIQQLRKTDENIQSDIDSLRLYESKFEISLESHEIRLEEHQQALDVINTAKKSLIDKAGKLQTEIDTIRSRMEELEKVSSQGVDVLKAELIKICMTIKIFFRILFVDL